MTLDEQLSALLDGDLPPDVAADLLDRIASDPDLAERWEALQALVLDLEALPLPELGEARVRTAVGEAPSRAWRPAVVLPLLASAAGLLVGLWWAPRPPAVVEVTEAGVSVGARALTVDGTPVPGGRIRLRADAGTVRIEVPGGLEVAGAPPGPDVPETRPGSLPGPGVAAEVLRLREEVAALRARLEVHEGRPLAWPVDLPALLRPDAFEDAVRAEVARHPGVQVRGFDCSELPCAVVLAETQDFRVPRRDWPSILYPLTDRLPEPWAVVHTVRTHDGDRSRTEVAVLAILDPALEESEEARLMFRSRTLIERFQPDEMR